MNPGARINPSLFEARTAGKRESERGKSEQIAVLTADILLQLAAAAWESREQRGAGARKHSGAAPAPRPGATKRSATERALKSGAGSGAAPGGARLPPQRGAAASAGCGGVFPSVTAAPAVRAAPPRRGVAFVSCGPAAAKASLSGSTAAPGGAAPSRTVPSSAPAHPEETHRPGAGHGARRCQQ